MSAAADFARPLIAPSESDSLLLVVVAAAAERGTASENGLSEREFVVGVIARKETMKLTRRR